MSQHYFSHDKVLSKHQTLKKLFEHLEKLGEGLNEVYFELPRMENDKFLGGSGAICSSAVSIIIKSDHYGKKKFVDYAVPHEYLHHYLIMEKKYPFYPASLAAEEQDLLEIYTSIYSFSHHFSIDKLMVDCGLEDCVMQEHQSRYNDLIKVSCFRSKAHEVSLTLALLEAEFWLRNNDFNSLRGKFKKISSGLSEKLLNNPFLREMKEDIFTAQGALQILTNFEELLDLPKQEIQIVKIENVR